MAIFVSTMCSALWPQRPEHERAACTWLPISKNALERRRSKHGDAARPAAALYCDHRTHLVVMPTLTFVTT
jgi:hypothetical protein